MSNHNYTHQYDRSAQHAADPRKKADGEEEILNTEEETIVNGEEDIVPDSEPVAGQNDESTDKQRGFKEGIKDDYLNEPELKDSDGQLEFPDEEG